MIYLKSICCRRISIIAIALFALIQPTFGALTLSVDHVSAIAGTQAVVSVKTDGFTNMVTAQGSIQFNPAIAEYSSIEVFGLPGMGLGHFGLADTANGFISFSWDDATFPNQSTNGITLANGSVLFSIKFHLVGSAGQITDVKLVNTPTGLEFTNNQSNVVSFQSTDGSITLTPCQTYLDCEDGDLCTFDNCLNNECSYEPVSCDDFLPCTIDGTCDPQTGNCSQPQSTCPDDGNLCTIEYCYFNGCESTLIDCDDGILCTDDHCEPANGECKHDAAPQLELNVQNPVCNGENGTITPAATGGTPYYEYFISGYPSFLDFINVPAGTYEVTAVDLNGCVATATAELFEPDPCDDGIACNGVETCDGITGECIPGDLNVCNDNNPCTADDCDFDTGNCLNDFDCNLSPSCCDDNNPCTEDVCQPDGSCSHSTFSVTLVKTDATCFCNGAIDLTTNGGNAPMMGFFWSNGSASEDINNLCPREYSVTVYDAVQCEATATVTVTGPDPLDAEFTGTAPICNGGEGSLSQNTTGGVSPYEYFILEINGVPLDEPIQIEFNPDYITDAGDYLIEVRDANGCSIQRNVSVENPAAVELQLYPTQPLCHGETGFVTGFAANGTEPYHFFTYNFAGDRLEVYFDPAYSVTPGTHIFEAEDANGCIDADTIEIIEPELLSLSLTPVHNLCPGDCNGTIDLTISGGNSAYYGISWSNNSFDEDLSGLCAGDYNVTVYDAYQCSATASVAITEPEGWHLVAELANPTCYGLCDGFADASLTTGGTPPYTYAWSNGETTARIEGICATDATTVDAFGRTRFISEYQCTVTDANGCTTELNFTLMQPLPLELELLEVQPTCHGTCDGSIDVIATGVQSHITLTWNNHDPVSSGELDVNTYGNGIDELVYILGYFCAGNYTVSGVDANGCTASSSIQITEPELLQLNLTATAPLCHGQNGSVSGGATGGRPPYHYYLLTGSDRLEVYFDPAYSIAPGTYTFEVEDASGTSIVGEEPTPGCITTITIEIPDVPECAEDSDPCTNDYCDQLTGVCNHDLPVCDADKFLNTVTCSCDCSAGSFSDINNGNVCTQCPPGFYQPLPGQSNCIPCPQGTYNDLTGQIECQPCLAGTSNPNTGATQCAPCDPGYAQPNAGSLVCIPCEPGYFSDVMGSQQCEECPPGYYQPLAGQSHCIPCPQGCTNPLACNYDADAQCDDGSCIVCDENLDCIRIVINQTGDLAGGHTGIRRQLLDGTYEWIALTTLPANQSYIEEFHCVDLTTGCYGYCVESYVAGNAHPEGSFINSIYLNGELLNSGPTGSDLCFSNFYAENGESPVFGCMDPLACNYDPAANCNSGCLYTGEACDDGNACTVNDLSDANCVCTGTPRDCSDGKPCTDDFCDPQFGCHNPPVSENTPCSDGDACNGLELCFNGICTSGTPSNLEIKFVVDQPLCHGESGTVYLSGSAGQPYPDEPYYIFYDEDFNEVTSPLSLAPGTYTFIVKDANGCTASGMVEIIEPELLSLSLVSVNPSCPGFCNGSIDLTATGGTGLLTFQWSNLEETEDISGLCPGTYSVIVTDKNGCTATTSAEIEEPILNVTLVPTAPSCNGVCDGSIDLQLTTNLPGTPIFLWLTGEMTEDLSGLCAGGYSVQVIIGQCYTYASTTVSEPEGWHLNADLANPTCYGLCDGFADASLTTGGTPPYTYAWSNGETTPRIEGICATDATTVDAFGRTRFISEYQCTVTDANGCTTELNFTLMQPLPLELELLEVQPTCHGSCDGSIDVIATGVQSHITLTWNNPEPVSSGELDVNTYGNGIDEIAYTIAPLCAGIYAVSGVDANGCTVSTSLTISEPAPLVLNLTATAPLCHGQNGTVAGEATGGTPPYRYYLNYAGDRLEVYFDPAYSIGAGTYEFTVEDANGCTTTQPIEIIEPELLQLELTSVNPLCHGGNGTVTGGATGGTEPYHYYLNYAGDRLEVYFDPAYSIGAGTYEFTVEDDNGCTATQTVEITEPELLQLNLTGTHPLCHGQAGTVTGGATGGTEPYHYYLDYAGDRLEVYFDPAYSAAPGIHEFTVEDANGCTITQTVEIIEPAPCDDGNSCTENYCDPQNGCHYPPVSEGTPCSDGDACNGLELCFNGICTTGNPINCDDGNVCTDDQCDPVTGNCVFTNNNANACSDGDACTIDLCAEGVCQSSPLCDDGNVCTDDLCSDGVCGDHVSNTPVIDIAFDKGLYCPGEIIYLIDHSTNLVSPVQILLGFPDDMHLPQSTSAYYLNDVVIESGDGSVWYALPDYSPDDDTLAEINPPSGSWGTISFRGRIVNPNGCKSEFVEITGTILNCDDGDPCTDDFCDADIDECRHEPRVCDDNNLCTIDECNEAGECKYNPVDCADTDPCTDDHCETATGECKHDPKNCDDGDNCTIDYCNEAGLCKSDPVQCDDADFCTNDFCDQSTGACVHSFDCNLSTSCCDDNNLCTNDFCIINNQGNPECTHVPVNCNDGDACTTDYCDALGKCNNDPVNCDDNDFCTIDVCFTNNLGEPECAHNPRNCDDNNICTDDVCVNACQNNAIPNCCHQDADCDDTNPCTFDKCTVNECEYNPISGCCLTAADCDDNDGCTTDACSPNHVCVHSSTGLQLSFEIQNPLCHGENGTITPTATGGTPPYNFFGPASGGLSLPPLFTGSLSLPAGTYGIGVTDANLCSVSGFATISEPPLCNDNNPCTNDACNEFGQCTFTPVNCDDGNPCTTDECNEAGECKYNPVDCADTDPCTDDHCETATGECKHDPKNCDDQNPCTIDECNEAGECKYNPVDCADTDPCTDDHCETATGECKHDPKNCDDQNPCTTDECNETGECKSSPIGWFLEAELANPSCFGVCDGFADASLTTGGTPPYTYAWSNGETTPRIEGICATDATTVDAFGRTRFISEYQCTITDANGCTTELNFTLMQPLPLELELLEVQPTCNGSCDGTIDVIATGVQSHITLTWNNPDPVSSGELDVNTYGNGIDELVYVLGYFCAGNYTVSGVDANGCTASGSIEIHEPAELDLQFVFADTLCENYNYLQFTADGGTAPYNVQLTYTTGDFDFPDEFTTSVFIPEAGALSSACGFGPGKYVFLLTDANGCTAMDSFHFTGPGYVDLTFDVVPPPCPGDFAIVTPSVSAEPGGRGYQPPYVFYGPDGNEFSGSISLPAGTHSIRVVDANGCIIEKDITIADPVPCDDNNICTDDACSAGVCSFTPLPNCCHQDADCDDTNPCTFDKCTVNECENNPISGCCLTAADCDDNDPCTVDNCSPENGPAIQWQNTIGGSATDQLNSAVQTSDGGYLLGGYSLSDISGDKTENSIGNGDYWVVKLDATGAIQWQHTIGGNGGEDIASVVQTTDGGYFIGGSSVSDISGDKTENSIGNSDYWVVKLDAFGNIQWDNTIGGSYIDVVKSAVQTADGGYFVGGHSNSNISGDKTEPAIMGRDDYWVVKLDASGNIQWENTIGGNYDDDLLSVAQTTDGGYILGGESESDISGDKTENSIGSNDYWVVKLDAFGNIQWENTIGGNYSDRLLSLAQTADGGYILGGESESDISGDKTENSIGNVDYWVVKLDATGTIQWQQTIGGSNGESLQSVMQTSDGGYLIGGNSNSDVSGDKTENSIGSNDYWVVKLDASGNIQWENTIGSNSFDVLSSAVQTTDGGYFVAGHSASNISGDKTENSLGEIDYWVVKLDATANSGVCTHTPMVCDDENPCTTDACEAGDCVYTPIANCCQTTAECEDRDLCTTNECVNHVCESTPVDCDDEEVCTVDKCLEGVCYNLEIPCDDFDECTLDFCDDVCQHEAIDCDDDDACTTDACDNGCLHTPVDCNDGNPCTLDFCDSGCKHTFNNCNDFNACTIDQCDGNGQCIHTPLDCSDNNPCTVDACFNGVCKNTPVSTSLSITTTALPQFCQGNTVTLTAVAPSAISFAWSSGETTPSISAAAGVNYTVTATFAPGCTRTLSRNVSAQSLLSSYVILVEREVEMERNTVFSGGVGATAFSGRIELHDRSRIIAPGTFAIARNIYVSGSSLATVRTYSPAPVSPPPFEFNPTCNGQNLYIPNNAVVTINGSNYRNVRIGRNCIVTFTQTNLNMRSLEADDNSELRFNDCAKLHICQGMELGHNNRFNIANRDVTVYVEKNVEIDGGSRVTADIYSLNGNIEIDDANQWNPNIMRGLFIARNVEADEHTHWYANTVCNPLCSTLPLAGAKMSEYPAGDEEETQDISMEERMLAPNSVELEAYPNPFSNKLNIEFTLAEDSRVKLEIFNLAGQLITELFEGNVKAGELQKYEFTPAQLADGMVIYRLQTASGSYYGKAVMVK